MPCDTVYRTTEQSLSLEGIDPKALRASMARHADEWAVSEAPDGFDAYNRITGATLIVRGKSARVEVTSESTFRNERVIADVQASVKQNYGAHVAEMTLKRFGFKQSKPATRTADGSIRLTFKR